MLGNFMDGELGSESIARLPEPDRHGPAIPERSPEGRRKYRTIWISDVHLGTKGCNAELLIDFLDSTDSETMYLVGDIMDRRLNHFSTPLAEMEPAPYLAFGHVGQRDVLERWLAHGAGPVAPRSRSPARMDHRFRQIC